VSDDERLMFHVKIPDHGILSLAQHRKQLSLEQELAEARAETEQLRLRLRALDGSLRDGELTRHSKEPCRWHLHVVVDKEAPRVECADCGTRLDPHTVLLEFAHKERMFRSSDAEARRERDELLAEIGRLKTQRSRLRTAVKKAGGTPFHPHQREIVMMRSIDGLTFKFLTWLREELHRPHHHAVELEQCRGAACVSLRNYLSLVPVEGGAA
jgi:hypothetical protein